jgi:SM-20-related protein
LISPDEAQSGNDLLLFESISNDIGDKGYSIQIGALPENLSSLLSQHITTLPKEKFKLARIGRGDELTLNDFVRTDEISWITNDSEASNAWIDWTTSLQSFLNRRLFLGLFSFESHFSHYSEGSFYKRHKDAFKGEDNRVLSVVVYLNENWLDSDGGELVIYNNQSSGKVITDNSTTFDGSTIVQEHKFTVKPSFGSVVVFLSEKFPHEVLPAKRDRYAIAGWYRLNTSIANNIDPPS